MLTFDTLMALARRSATVTQPCGCAACPFAGWERVPPAFPESQLRQIGTLMDDPYAEPTYTEYHPSATEYWSTLAPIAPRYFPYNRCAVVECAICGRTYLRYTEAGGYYVEQRIRALDPERLVDAPAPPI
ncbi:MAG: hypothetical protein V4578_03210 [Pseudomonadota bacterium]